MGCVETNAASGRRAGDEGMSSNSSRKESLGQVCKEPRSALNELATIVHPSTIGRWIRPASDKVAKAQKNVGRPRTAEQIEKLILKLAKDNSWATHRKRPNANSLYFLFFQHSIIGSDINKWIRNLDG